MLWLYSGVQMKLQNEQHCEEFKAELILVYWKPFYTAIDYSFYSMLNSSTTSRMLAQSTHIVDYMMEKAFTKHNSIKLRISH